MAVSSNHDGSIVAVIAAAGGTQAGGFRCGAAGTRVQQPPQGAVRLQTLVVRVARRRRDLRPQQLNNARLSGGT